MHFFLFVSLEFLSLSHHFWRF